MQVSKDLLSDEHHTGKEGLPGFNARTEVYEVPAGVIDPLERPVALEPGLLPWSCDHGGVITVA